MTDRLRMRSMRCKQIISGVGRQERKKPERDILTHGEREKRSVTCPRGEELHEQQKSIPVISM